jgi:hypothetical protein
VLHVCFCLTACVGWVQIPDPVGYVVTRWGKEPYSLGAYTYSPVGFTSKDMERVER